MEDFMFLKAKKIISVDTCKGYMQVLEYCLQDLRLLHVVQWHFLAVDDDGIPICYNETFYNCKDEALEFAEEIGNNLLKQIINQ